MKTTRKRWTAEEERVLADQVTRHCYNLKEAFKKAATILDRSEAACGFHWYAVMAKKEDAAVCFALVGRTKSINKKLVVDAPVTETSTTWWKKVLRLLRLQ